jgi:hypothetical protein
MAGLVFVPTAAEIRELKWIFNRTIILFFSFIMFWHALAMVMYYNKMVSNGVLIRRAKTYSVSRM